jgi:hypothetical protein
MPDVAIAIASDSVDISKIWVLTIYSFHCALLSTDFSAEPVDIVLKISIAQLAITSTGERGLESLH